MSNRNNFFISTLLKMTFIIGLSFSVHLLKGIKNEQKAPNLEQGDESSTLEISTNTWNHAYWK